jgi:hypothetical protein
MLIVVTRLPAGADALAEAARITGLARVDVGNRLTGLLPRVLCAEPDAERAGAIAAALEARGFSALACDPAAAPGDDERVVAHALELGPAGLVAVDGGGQRETCPAEAIALVQRGARSATKRATSTTSTRRLDLGRALLTGGLSLTKRVERTETTTETTFDPFLLVHRRDGGADLVLYERRLDYRFLGPAIAASSRANFELLTARLRALAPAAPFDDRTSRPGFLGGIRYAAGDPVDLALHVVWLAHLRGGAPAG